MKVHPIQTLGVKAILDLPAPPQVWRINWNPDHQKVPRHPASVWRVSLLQLVSPKPCPHPQVLNLQVGFSSPAPRKRTWRMNSWLDLKKGSFGFLCNCTPAVCIKGSRSIIFRQCGYFLLWQVYLPLQIQCIYTLCFGVLANATFELANEGLVTLWWTVLWPNAARHGWIPMHAGIFTAWFGRQVRCNAYQNFLCDYEQAYITENCVLSTFAASRQKTTMSVQDEAYDITLFWE